MHNIADLKKFQVFIESGNILPWDSLVAGYYGKLRAEMQKSGKIMGNLYLLIAAHALALELTLVTNDRAFREIKGLKIEDWTQ